VEKLSNLQSEPSTAQESLSPMGILLTHLDAAYNLARWLLRDQTEAEDAVQEAYLRAFRHCESFRGGDGRAWLLTIVRNRCYDRLKEGAVFTDSTFEEEAYASKTMLNQESALLQLERTAQVRRAFEKLPAHLREVLALREFEEMSYSEIAAVVGIPMGTVMSRLSRGRLQLKQMFSLGCEENGTI
jgi:RNA polymerase sigma-70 factor (ECF subfamily)